MVLRTSLRESRKTALLVALGIASGEAIHVSYTILGLGIIIHESTWMMEALRYVGAGYLIFIGFTSLRAKKESLNSVDILGQNFTKKEISAASAWAMGFFTNALNVKAAFFTISCFVVFVSPETSIFIRAFYGLFIVATTMLWFSIVVFGLTNTVVQRKFVSMKHLIERTAGIVLIVLGVQLALGSL